MRISWVGKASLFRFPFGAFMRWTGGVPVIRDQKLSQVQRIVGHHHQLLAIPLLGFRGDPLGQVRALPVAGAGVHLVRQPRHLPGQRVAA